MTDHTANPRPAAYEAPARRLSFWRTLLALVVVALLVAGSWGGWQYFSATRAVASYKPWFAGYVDVTATPTQAFESPASAAQKNVVLSFIVAAKDDACTPTWGTAYTLDAASSGLDLDRRIARLKQIGGDATISFGGAANNELATGCTAPKRLAAAYKAVTDRYQTNHIDLDIEGAALTDAAAGQRRATAIKTVQNAAAKTQTPLTVWLTLPVAPTGLTTDGTRAVSQMLAAGVMVSGVNLMTMDYGASKAASTSMADASIAALTAAHAQLTKLNQAAGNTLTAADLWSRIGATPMLGQNDETAEMFGLADARKLNAFAQEKQLGRLSVWSLNRDRACSPNYVDLKKVSDSCSGVGQDENAFAGILAAKFTATPGQAPPAAGASATPTSTASTTAIAPIEDNPLTSPYPIWSVTTVYPKGIKVVQHGNVYETIRWSQGDTPDNPVLQDYETPWKLVGPVLATDTPQVQIKLPKGTYGDWSPTAIYLDKDRVLLDGVPYESKWWNQATSPSATNGDAGPWRILTGEEVTAALHK